MEDVVVCALHGRNPHVGILFRKVAEVMIVREAGSYKLDIVTLVLKEKAVFYVPISGLYCRLS